jgi:spore maturation protein CgeB
MAANICVTGFLPPDRMNAFFASAKIFMGIVHPQMLTGIGQRIFDAAVAEAFILAEYKADIDMVFPQGEVETFKNQAELRDKAVYYLDHPGERRAKARAARARVLSEHTWEHRAQKMLDIVFG